MSALPRGEEPAASGHICLLSTFPSERARVSQAQALPRAREEPWPRAAAPDVSLLGSGRTPEANMWFGFIKTS